MVDSVEANGQAEISMGTTVVALRTKQGLVVGADTRTSMGSMVSNRFAHKLSFIYQSSDIIGVGSSGDNDGVTTCIMCRSGSAADTQYLADEVRWTFRTRALRYGIYHPTIYQIAHWLRFEVRKRQQQSPQNPYSASLLIAGYEPSSTNSKSDGNGRGRIYSIAQTGSLIEEDLYAIAGSGSTYIVGLIDHAFKERNKQSKDNGNEVLMEEEEAIEFVSALIHTAMARDGSSGGFARITVVNAKGSQEFSIPPTSSSLSSLSSSITTSNDGKRSHELPGFKSASKPKISSTTGRSK